MAAPIRVATELSLAGIPIMGNDVILPPAAMPEDEPPPVRVAGKVAGIAGFSRFGDVRARADSGTGRGIVRASGLLATARSPVTPWWPG